MASEFGRIINQQLTGLRPQPNSLKGQPLRIHLSSSRLRPEQNVQALFYLRAMPGNQLHMADLDKELVLVCQERVQKSISAAGLFAPGKEFLHGVEGQFGAAPGIHEALGINA